MKKSLSDQFVIHLDATVDMNLENGLRPADWNPWARGKAIEVDIAEKSKGKYGLQVLASVLIALEADYYVLTTSSNISRLINEVRLSILDVICGNCTKVIDLQPEEW